MVSGALVGRMVRAPGIRFSRTDSICDLRIVAAELKICLFTVYSLFIHFREYDSYRKGKGCQGTTMGSI